MKLSVITDEISMDLAHALDVMQEYGATGAELRSIWGHNIADISDEDAEKALAIVRDRGMDVSCIASPILKCELDAGSGGGGQAFQASERTLADQPAAISRCADLATFFGTKLIRIFSFWKRGELTPEVEERIVQELSKAAEIARQKEVVLVLENEHACYLGTGEETARVLRKVNSPHLKAVWDPGNAFFAGENPFPDGYRAIKEYVDHVHLKDALRLDTGECRFVVVGDGQIDFPGQFAALENDGYDGWYSLETHYRPYGSDGETGSRLSLAALNKMLQGAAGRS
jgi:sugar phosphate isomerase/epimerase